MDNTIGLKLAEIIDTLKQSVNNGDLGAIADSVTALEGVAVDIGEGQQQQQGRLPIPDRQRQMIKWRNVVNNAIIDILRRAVDTGDLVTALQDLAFTFMEAAQALEDEPETQQQQQALEEPSEEPQGQQQQQDPHPEDAFWAAAHALEEAGDLEIIREGKEPILKLTPRAHDEQADAQNYVLWCEGRLEELKRSGLLTGPSSLTEAGWQSYKLLVASGFAPSREKVMWTLERVESVPNASIDQLLALMLDEGKDADEHE